MIAMATTSRERRRLKGKRVVVVGLGKSGLASSLWLAQQGADVIAGDLRNELELPEPIIENARKAGIRLELGGHDPATFCAAELIVLSPGVPPEIDPVSEARKRGVPIIGEMELACRYLRLPMVGVTGTNGKSTVTELLGEILSAQGHRVFVGGNLGTPLMDLVEQEQNYDWAVVEISSFQLDTMESFRPEVSVILNISPDHLDRYPDYDAYARSKLRIFRFQKPGQTVILNDDDERLRVVIPHPGLQVLRYGMEYSDNRAAWIDEEQLVLELGERGRESFRLERFSLPGGHNLQNLMAAALAARTVGADREAIQGGIDSFKGLKHRLELVGTIRGVSFYDDSKATNVDAAVRSVESVQGPVVLIAGGRHKGGDYGPLVRAGRTRIKRAVFIGEASGLLAKVFEGVVPYVISENMDQAVTMAFEGASQGDAVLLAPACSSFDMFTDYTHRGRMFADAVRRLSSGG